MFDLLKRAKDLGIEVQIDREYIQTRVYTKGGKQAHLIRFKTIEGLSGFIDGFNVARRAALEEITDKTEKLCKARDRLAEIKDL